MDKKKLLLGTTLVALSAVAVPQNANAITTTVAISAVILQAISASVVTSMNFGSLLQLGTAPIASAMLDNTDGITVGATVSDHGTPTAGTVKATATAGAVLSFNTTATFVNVAGPGPSMAVDSFTCNGGALPCGVTAVGGTATADFGATLNIGAAQTAGAYTGSFKVTVGYQ